MIPCFTLTDQKFGALAARHDSSHVHKKRRKFKKKKKSANGESFGGQAGEALGFGLEVSVRAWCATEGTVGRRQERRHTSAGTPGCRSVNGVFVMNE